jgi:hypothetical protein
MAWTVNDVKRADKLIKLGASVITTDNLAIMEALGGPKRREENLQVIVQQDRQKRQSDDAVSASGS